MKLTKNFTFYSKMITFKQVIVAILGNVATNFSFIPFFPNFIHKIRGVNRTETFISLEQLLNQKESLLSTVEMYS